MFINNVIDFIIVAFAIFILVREINKLRRRLEGPPPVPSTRECPYCLSKIPPQAARCAYCTSELKPA